MLDFILRRGTVVDGTGSPSFIGDVGVRGDKISAIGILEPDEQTRVIEAEGRIVCPGFIDVHCHSEILLLRGGGVEERSSQGITTDFLAPDGLSYAPINSSRLSEMEHYLEPFYGPSPAHLKTETFEGYWEQFQGDSPINVVPQVGFNSLRYESVGWRSGPASGDELANMKRLAEEGMQAGASGLQTGLDYLPGGHASTDELSEVVGVVAREGGIHSSHVRGVVNTLPRGVDEAVEIGVRTGVQTHLSHLFPDDRIEETLDRATSRGLDITFDVYPYMAAASHLSFCLPHDIQHGPPTETIERLKDPSERERVRDDINGFVDRFGEENIVFAGVASAELKSIEGMSLSDSKPAMDAADFICDILVESELDAEIVMHWDDPAKLRAALTHPRSMIASDGLFHGARPHPRGFGAHARVIREFVVNRGWLTTEDAIRRMTGSPAARYGLTDRGVIKPNRAADLVVFDPDQYRDNADFSDGRKPSSGVEFVWVNGSLVIDQGTSTGAMTGRVLRRPGSESQV